MDNKAKKLSLFDYFLDEINNEELQCDITVTDDGKSVNDVCTSDENEKDSTNNMDINLNEFNNNCEIMVKSLCA